MSPPLGGHNRTGWADNVHTGAGGNGTPVYYFQTAVCLHLTSSRILVYDVRQDNVAGFVEIQRRI